MHGWQNVWVGAIVGGSIIVHLWCIRRGQEAIRGWADAEGFTIVESSKCLFAPHWRMSKGYQFFRVTIRDKHGLARRGWIRCSVLGDSDSVEVIWDEK